MRELPICPPQVTFKLEPNVKGEVLLIMLFCRIIDSQGQYQTFDASSIKLVKRRHFKLDIEEQIWQQTALRKRPS
mgnify:CR=1 FL=1